jgi:hypothetical protein
MHFSAGLPALRAARQGKAETLTSKEVRTGSPVRFDPSFAAYEIFQRGWRAV